MQGQDRSAVLLIDHHRARFFETGHDGRLVEREHLEPKDPHGFERHLEHRKEAHYQGERVPEATEFYERVAERLGGASSIVLIGDATGKSSALRYFVEFLEKRHKELARRVVTTERADLSSIGLAEIQRIAQRHA